MTENEAIEKLKNMRLFMQIEDKINDFKFTEDDYKANEMAIQALEKQIPKKPETVKADFLNCTCRCPVCNSRNIVGYDTEYSEYDANDVFSYCSDCGQKLDWSDNN